MNKITDFFNMINSSLGNHNGSLHGFAAKAGSGKTFFMLLIAEYYLRFGRNVHFFDGDGMRLNIIQKRLSDKMGIGSVKGKFIFHNVYDLEDLKQKTRGIDRNDIIIIDPLSYLYSQKDKRDNNTLSFLQGYNVFYTAQVYKSIDLNMGDVTTTLPNTITHQATNIFTINLEDNWDFTIKTVKSITCDFNGTMNYNTPLKHIIRKEKIKNILSWV